MMKLRLCLLAACVALTACSSAPVADPPEVAKTGYGVFVGIGPSLESRLAEETVSQLMRVGPASEHLLDFQQRIASEDHFGHQLMSYLQRDGYFIRQWHDPAMKPQCNEKLVGKKSNRAAMKVLPVCYVVDSVDGLVRLTLYAAGDVWSRFFAEKQGALCPVGAWTQQKGE